jgi:peroxiredoxin family protein
MRRLAMVSGRGQASPRASTVVTLRIVPAPAYSVAAVLATGELERLYSGLSVLVSSASAGERCGALASFRALEALLAGDLLQRAAEPSATPVLSWAGRDTFARSLLELRETALGLEGLDVYACSASVETMSLTAGAVEERLAGVMSTPRFLDLTAGARLLFV